MEVLNSVLLKLLSVFVHLLSFWLKTKREEMLWEQVIAGLHGFRKQWHLTLKELMEFKAGSREQE